LWCLPGADERIRIRKWLQVVAHNKSFDFVTRQEPFGEPLTHDPPGEDPTVRLEARDALRVAFYRVNRAERGVLAGVAQGDTLAEIAAALGIPPGTAGTTIRRVRKALKKHRKR
jgi:RNA polymerase sigma-70 factor (ECF subfamily)